jgi:hypothetical protein
MAAIKRRARDPSIDYLRLRPAKNMRPANTAAPMPNSAICSGSGTGVGVPPEELGAPPVLVLPPVLLWPPLDDPPHLPNQHQKVALADAGVARPIRLADPAIRRSLLIFIFVTPFGKDTYRVKRPCLLLLSSLCANSAERRFSAIGRNMLNGPDMVNVN